MATVALVNRWPDLGNFYICNRNHCSRATGVASIHNSNRCINWMRWNSVHRYSFAAVSFRIRKLVVNMSNSSSSSSGIGFVGLLTVAFIVLKLCHDIDWSWWWVLSPVWITAIIIVLILSIALLGAWRSGQLRRPKTPEEKAIAACRQIAKKLSERQ
jgi:hypothetical protein